MNGRISNVPEIRLRPLSKRAGTANYDPDFENMGGYILAPVACAGFFGCCVGAGVNGLTLAAVGRRCVCARV